MKIRGISTNEEMGSSELLPWKLIITIVTMMISLAQVHGWILPREITHLSLPLDYPSESPFYRIIAVPDFTQSNSSSIHFILQTEDSNSHGRRRLKINPDNGYLSLEMHSKNKKRKTVRPMRNLTATVLVNNNQNSTITKTQKSIISVSFRHKSTHCGLSHYLCFPDPVSKYRLPESLSPTVLFDTLSSVDVSTCKNLTTSYRVIQGEELIAVSPNKGDLSLKHPLDWEDFEDFQFKVECALSQFAESPARFTMIGEIEVIDINNHAPTTQSGDYSASLQFNITKFNENLTFPVSVIDKDSKEVNDFRVYLEDDHLAIFSSGRSFIFGNIQDKNFSTFFRTEIMSVKKVSFPEADYNFSVIIEDVSLQSRDNKVVFSIRLLNTSMDDKDRNISFNDVYEVSVSSTASKYARILILINEDVSEDVVFQLKENSQDTEGFGITKHSGILFLKQPILIANLTILTLEFNVSWISKYTTGTIKVIARIENRGEDFKASQKCEQWCSSYNSEDKCQSGCGLGSPEGHCFWREGPYNQMSPYYSTCSPDFVTCPDQKCDELERMVPTLCQQDCTGSVVGQYVMNPVSKRGIIQAVGPCVCTKTLQCICKLPTLPNEPRRTESPQRSIQIFTLSSKVPEIGEEDIAITSYPGSGIGDINPITSLPLTEICGRSCVAFIFLGVCCFFVTSVVVFLIMKIRQDQKKKHKYVGSRTSLSAVQSDYVDERSSSVQDSRQLSESSGSTKAQSDTKWEFPREKLILQEVLGEGEFGKVVKAEAWNISGRQGYTTVAVKMIKDASSPSELQDLVSEFQLMKEVEHPNVIRLLGACTEKSEPFYIIVEHAEYGSLRSYLRKSRQTYQVPRTRCVQNPTYIIVTDQEGRCETVPAFTKELMSFSWQIAKGMAYLSDMKLVHRDLAARNVLLAAGKVAKISDFGLARDVYEGDTYLKKSKGRVPLKWMAIESLEDNLYTTRSDVWSFGVVLWEIMTQGATPYPGITSERMYHLLKAGYRMNKPDNSSDEMYQIMMLCWREVPHERPSFKDLVQKLDGLLQDSVEYLQLGSHIQGCNCDDRNPNATPVVQTLPKVQENGIQYTILSLQDEESPQESQERIGLVNIVHSEEDNL